MSLNHQLDNDLMLSNPHYQRLHHLHEKLEEQIHEENGHALVDVQKLKLLKRRKLLVADEMFTLSVKEK